MRISDWSSDVCSSDLITERITRIKKDLEQVQRTRGLHRGARQRVPYPVVALVGYTNAGKSTLFNRLTEARVLARDQLFATLDPTMRRVRLPSGQTRSEEHTSELQSLMRISYAVFCLKKKNKHKQNHIQSH